uniref:Uncharacterized protein n=1 Tax=Cucumis sativus TaxID=3659 RepID=A0A0A0L3U0_CUCSA
MAGYSTHYLAFPRASTITWGDDTRYWSWATVDFCSRQPNVWLKIPIGKFILRGSLTSGTIRFGLYNHEGNWKRGLNIRALAIQA